MKVEYVTSTLGIGTELHISSAEYKRVNSEAGWSEHPNLMFAVRSYAKENQCTNIIKNRIRFSKIFLKKRVMFIKFFTTMGAKISPFRKK